MMYEVEFTPGAEDDLARLDAPVAQRVLKRLRWLAEKSIGADRQKALALRHPLRHAVRAVSGESRLTIVCPGGYDVRNWKHLRSLQRGA